MNLVLFRRRICSVLSYSSVVKCLDVSVVVKVKIVLFALIIYKEPPLVLIKCHDQILGFIK